MLSPLVIESPGRTLVVTIGPTQAYPGLPKECVQLLIETDYVESRFPMTSHEAAVLRDWLVEKVGQPDSGK